MVLALVLQQICTRGDERCSSLGYLVALWKEEVVHTASIPVMRLSQTKRACLVLRGWIGLVKRADRSDRVPKVMTGFEIGNGEVLMQHVHNP